MLTERFDLQINTELYSADCSLHLMIATEMVHHVQEVGGCTFYDNK
jgi:hypothetical protein